MGARKRRAHWSIGAHIFVYKRGAVLQDDPVMPITTIDRAAAEQIRRLVNEALTHVAAQHGLKLTAGRCKYTDSNAVFTLTASVVSQDGVAQTPERTSYTTNCELYGLKREWLDQRVVVNGTSYTVAGLKPSSFKYPVLLKSANTGTMFKFKPESLVKAMELVSNRQRAAHFNSENH